MQNKGYKAGIAKHIFNLSPNTHTGFTRLQTLENICSCFERSSIFVLTWQIKENERISAINVKNLVDDSGCESQYFGESFFKIYCVVGSNFKV